MRFAGRARCLHIDVREPDRVVGLVIDRIVAAARHDRQAGDGAD
jgi:hypothetical protein